MVSEKITHIKKELLAVKEQNKKLSPIHILKALAEEGITSLLIEGGQAVLSSFILKNLIRWWRGLVRIPGARPVTALCQYWQ